MKDLSLGISGIALDLPPYRVSLESWCDWTGNSWDKIRNVVGHSFRMRGPEQNVYTMAANAVLRLIERYDVDPSRVGFLGLGTESSTDNSAGAVIVKGMVNRALAARGLPVLARSCEVPEFKQACLGGIYALKGALRYLACDGVNRQAIAVCADIAEYARGSSGEPTQGAGAVALLLEARPRLAAVELAWAGNASDYRHVDFRKPMNRFYGKPARANGQIQDLPVFNGKYSTTCYIDATLHAVEAMLARREMDRRAYFDDLAAVFMHRPYRRMPQSAWALAYLSALARSDAAARAELAEYAGEVGVDLEQLHAEITSSPDVMAIAEERALHRDAHPLALQVLKVFRANPAYARIVDDKMRLGSELMMEMGNLYTAALPAWLAAGLEEAAHTGLDLTGRELLTVGYGSGDAAEAIPLSVVPGWQEAALRIQSRDTLDGYEDLTREQYEALHDGQAVSGLEYEHAAEFVLERVGDSAEPEFQDAGIEYYRYVE